MGINVLDIVRLRVTPEPSREWSGSGGFASRAPKEGDEGTVVNVTPDANCPITVERVDEHGDTVWLADFQLDELQVVGRPPAA